jgi:tubulin polyglutamylase TTLL4
VPRGRGARGGRGVRVREGGEAEDDDMADDDDEVEISPEDMGHPEPPRMLPEDDYYGEEEVLRQPRGAPGGGGTSAAGGGLPAAGAAILSAPPTFGGDNRPDLPPLIDFLQYRAAVNGTVKAPKPPKRESPPLIMKVGTSSAVVRNAFQYAGYRIVKSGRRFHSYWGKHMKREAFAGMGVYQKVNHFPGTFEIGRKDRLYRNLSRMKRHHPSVDFSFFPQTWILPYDYEDLKRDFAARPGTLIVKPPASARGQGIKVISKLADIPRRKNALIQKYLDDPFLLDGYKFDLRIYVLVTSFDPLRVYVFEDGLVRFCTEKFKRGAKYASHKFMHLTNYSVQKKRDEYIENKDATRDNEGSKWSIKALKRWFAERRVEDRKLWTAIDDVIIKTLLSVEDPVNTNLKMHARQPGLCYELFGFDIFVDSALKPWVLEVNISPSLESSSPLDRKIKGDLCSDMFQLLCFRAYDRDAEDRAEAEASTRNLQGVTRQKSSRSLKPPSASTPDVTRPETLSTEELRVLKESDLEYRRKGAFRRIFPPEKASELGKYDHLFTFPRRNNALLAAWVRKGHPVYKA